MLQNLFSLPPLRRLNTDLASSSPLPPFPRLLLLAGVLLLTGGLSVTSAQTISFSQESVNSVDESEDVYATDLDGDTDIDVVSAHSDDDKIKWHENDGSQNFTTRTITSSADAVSVYATDVDGDTDIDILSANRGNDEVIWYENDGTSDPSFTRRVIDKSTVLTGPDSPASVYAADVDGDGDTDVLSVGAGTGGDVNWYENDGASDPSFTTHEITQTINNENGQTVYAADVDGDGDTDILAESGDGIKLFENDGANDPSFTTRTVDTDTFSDIYMADVDGDTDPDLFATNSTDNEVVWYENKNGESDADADGFGDKQILNPSADFANSVYATDVNGDGETDVLSSSSNDGTVNWYENDGSENFTTRTVVSGTKGPQAVFATDLDKDGDTDVLAAQGLNLVGVDWYKQPGDPPPSISNVSLGGDGSGNLTFSFDSNEPLGGAPSAIAVSVDGPSTPDVYTFNGGDFSESGSGPYTYSLFVGQAYDDGEGTYTASVDDALDPAANNGGNNGAGSGLTASYTFDNTPPTVTQIVRSAPSSDRTNQSSVTFTVSFSESVVNIGTDDFTPNSDAGVSATLAGTSTNSGTSTEVTVNAISGDGTLGLNLDSGGDIEDQAGNPLDTPEPSTDQTYTIDNTPPPVPSGLSTRTESGNVVLSWDDAGSLDEYHIYRDTAPISDLSGRTPLATPSTGTTSYTDPDAEQGTTYYYHVTTVDAVGNESALSDAEKAALTESEITETKLLPNAPNPFSESTTISYQLAEEQRVTITIYNALGRRVTTLVNTVRSSGDYNVTWSAGDANRLGSGAYFCRMEAGSYTESEKLVLVR